MNEDENKYYIQGPDIVLDLWNKLIETCCIVLSLLIYYEKEGTCFLGNHNA